MSQEVKRVYALVGRRMDVPTDIQMNGQMNRGSKQKMKRILKMIYSWSFVLSLIKLRHQLDF